MGKNIDYSKNVFVNCPFDHKYKPLLHSLLFTLIYLDYNPRISLERSNSGETRITKIYELINESKYSIHDLSRIRSSRIGEYYRLNMPFELGLDIGAKIFNERRHREKCCLILEEEQFRFQIAISDISNSDIKHHQGKARNLMKAVRTWFAENGEKHIDCSSVIWRNYIEYKYDLYEKKKREGFSKKEIDDMPVKEIIDYMKEWKQIISSFTYKMN